MRTWRSMLALGCGLLLAVTAGAVLPPRDTLPLLTRPVLPAQTNDLLEQFGVIGNNCLGRPARDIGQSRVPEPPAIITPYRIPRF